MPDHHTDHALNALLAEVAGVELQTGGITTDPFWWVGGASTDIWTPLTDHNQMALVKAGLNKNGWIVVVTTCPTQAAKATILGKVTSKCWEATDPDELRAFGEAVATMKETTHAESAN